MAHHAARLRGVIVLLLVLRLGDALTVGFEQFLIQRRRSAATPPRSSTPSRTTTASWRNNFSYGAAAGLFKGVVSLVLILVANKVAHLFGEDGVYRSAR